MIIFIGWHRPLDSNFANNMELLNEGTTMFSLYLVMTFSDFVGDPLTRNMCGWAFIGVVSFLVMVHLLFLVGSVCGKIYQSMRRCYYKEKRFEAMEAIRAKKEALDLAKAEKDSDREENQVEVKHRHIRSSIQLAVIKEEAEGLDSEISGSLRSDPPLA